MDSIVEIITEGYSLKDSIGISWGISGCGLFYAACIEAGDWKQVNICTSKHTENLLLFHRHYFKGTNDDFKENIMYFRMCEDVDLYETLKSVTSDYLVNFSQLDNKVITFVWEGKPPAQATFNLKI